MKKRLTRLVAILLVLVFMISVVGCEKQKPVNELTNCETGVFDFAVRLLQNSQENGENVSVSPLSVLSALAMTVNGAEGETCSEMEAVLGMPVSELNDYMKQYAGQLPRGEAYRLNLANGIWFTDNVQFTVNQDFLQTNKDYYEADIRQVPFNDETCQEINNWVNEKTEEMIPEILQSVPEDAVMYLVNALAFEAEWQDVYNEEQVREGIFTTETGEEKTVQFMYGQENSYLEDKKATGFVKYYKQGKYAFVALLPNEGVSVSEYVSSLTGEHLQTMLAEPEDIKVNSAIPKFEAEYSTEMSAVLKKMGMPLAFDSVKADFSGLGSYSGGNIYIDQVLHKTYISVAEKGTKAGAATAVQMKFDSAPMPQEIKTVHLDRPFLYMLIDCEQNYPFFMGTMGEMAGQRNVEHTYKDSQVTIDLPESWEYEIEENELRIWPKGQTKGKITILYHEGLFGVCGTGLTTEKITLGGQKASKGTYDGDKMWMFITFEDEANPYVIRSDGADVWWDVYGEEAMEILGTINF